MAKPSKTDLRLDMIEKAYQIASGQDNWQDFMGLFSAFPAVKISMIKHNHNFSKLDTLIPHNYDPEFIKSYINYYAKKNPKTAFSKDMLQNPNGCWGHDFIRPDLLAKTEFYQDWLRPQGNLATGYGYNIIQEKAGQNDRYISFISHVSVDYIEETEEIKRLMHDVGDHLRRSLALQKHLIHQKIHYQNFEHVLNCLQNPVIITDKKGKLYFANHWAEKLLSQGDLIHLDRGKVLTFNNPIHENMAKHQLAGLTSPDNHTDHLSLQLRTSNNDLMTLFTSPITMSPTQTKGFDLFWKTPGYIAWFFIKHTTLPQVDENIVKSVLGVTSAEAKLAVALMQNKTLLEYSVERGIKISTARVQLKSLREKTNSQNQQELVGLLNRLFGSFKL